MGLSRKGSVHHSRRSGRRSLNFSLCRAGYYVLHATKSTKSADKFLSFLCIFVAKICRCVPFLVKICVDVSQTYPFKELKFNDLCRRRAVRELSLH